MAATQSALPPQSELASLLDELRAEAIMPVVSVLVAAGCLLMASSAKLHEPLQGIIPGLALYAVPLAAWGLRRWSPRAGALGARERMRAYRSYPRCLERAGRRPVPLDDTGGPGRSLHQHAGRHRRCYSVHIPLSPVLESNTPYYVGTAGARISAHAAPDDQGPHPGRPEGLAVQCGGKRRHAHISAHDRPCFTPTCDRQGA